MPAMHRTSQPSPPHIHRACARRQCSAGGRSGGEESGAARRGHVQLARREREHAHGAITVHRFVVARLEAVEGGMVRVELGLVAIDGHLRGGLDPTGLELRLVRVRVRVRARARVTVRMRVRVRVRAWGYR